MKKIIKSFIVLLMINICCFTSYAMEKVELPSLDNKELVHFEADVPDGFNYDIEIYLNQSAYYMTNASGYSIDISLVPDEYEVRTIISNDVYDQYQTSHAEILNTTTDSAFYITVTATENAEDLGGGEEHDFEIHEEVEETIPAPQIFDFSGGKEYGTLLISSETYSAIESATFRLVGENDIYDIPLTSEYFGRAEVRLPVGSYYESGSIDVELDQDASLPEGFSFLWQHENKPGVWGDYYDIAAGQSYNLDDLIIVMSSGSTTSEISSDLLFSKTYTENRNSVRERDRQKELESAFPEIYGTSETETIAEAQPVEPSADYNNIIQIAIITVSVLTVIGIAIAIIRKRKS